MTAIDPSQGGNWTRAGAPHQDVVLTCRARLARNLAGFPFTNRSSPVQRREILHLVRETVLGADLAPSMIWVDMAEATERDRRLLVERHLVSNQHAEAEHERGVAISGDEALAIMVNEEDHLRMQLLAPGMQLSQVHEAVDAVDDKLEAKLDFAFDRRFGYLTACPTNVGTGIRFSVMMHLPGLRITSEINRVRRAARDLHLAVRGYYGEGSESAGDFYQISNQVTLGRTETNLLAEFEDVIIPRIIEYEHQARRVLMERNRPLLEDRVHRALGTLRVARLIGTEEAMKLLSRVRLGIFLDIVDDVEIATVNRLFLTVQPAHLKLESQSDGGGDELRLRRATTIRRALAGE